MSEAPWSESEPGPPGPSPLVWPLFGLSVSVLSVMLLGWLVPQLAYGTLTELGAISTSTAAIGALGGWRVAGGTADWTARWMVALAAALAVICSGLDLFMIGPEL